MTGIAIPRTFKFLFEPKRYKVLYGGRGGAKSHNIARALLVLGMQKPMRIVCAREIQQSIKDSVHKLLSDLIRSHDLTGFYQIQETVIKGKNGTEFMFRGLKHNTADLKSLEGADICWIEEAENVSDNSYEILIPTLRKDGSEIWVSFNPKRPSDPTYKRFVALVDDDIAAKRVSWRDNPFFPEVLEKERVRLEKADPVAYRHIWEGDFDERNFGGVYTKQIADIRAKGQISGVPYDRAKPVVTAWDLGFGDSTAVWFAQLVGKEARIIDYYENANEPIDHYVKIVKERPYIYDAHFLPHDAKNGQLGTGQSIADQLKGMGLNSCKVLGNTSIAGGVELARQLIPKCWFDAKTCAEGLRCLEAYQYEYDEIRATFKDKPLHDWSSHASDAFRYLAHGLVNYGQQEYDDSEVDYYRPSEGAWMG